MFYKTLFKRNYKEISAHLPDKHLIVVYLHCIAEIRAYWVEPKPFQIDNPRHQYQIA